MQYIGSTISQIKHRYSQHKQNYKYYLEEKYRYCSSFEIVNYNDCYVELVKEVYCTKKQLLILEGEEIKKHENCVVNIQIAGNQIQYHDRKEYEKVKNSCFCGGKFTNGNKAIHIKTPLHQNYIGSHP